MKKEETQNYIVRYATGKSTLSYAPAKIKLGTDTVVLTLDKQEVFKVSVRDITSASLFMRFNDVRSAKMTVKVGDKAYNLGFDKASKPKELLSAFKSIGVKTIDIGRYTNIGVLVIFFVTFLWIFVVRG